MANQEHLDLITQGVAVWDAWRAAHPDVRPDLSGANLSVADLIEANLSVANLSVADLSRADLIGAGLSEADLSEADLSGADLRGAVLRRAHLGEADLRRAHLRRADLRGANLSVANLSGVDLRGADLTDATIGYTTLTDCDLSTVISLVTVKHVAPSSIGVDTLYRSQGTIPESFLRGCGVPDALIEYLPSLLGAMEPIQFYSCFISYSSKDEPFARRLHERMQAEHLRVWFAPEDLKGGQKLHEQIDDAIRVYDKLVLILSEHSMASAWVQQELRRARRAELTSGRRKLFPIRLVDFEALQDWECPDSRSGGDLAEEVRQYFIPDFTTWKDPDAFEVAFAQLLRDLQAVDAPPPALTPSLATPTSSGPSAREALLATKRRRLAILEVQAAQTGYNAPPEVVMEIEDLRKDIAALEAGDG